MRVIVSLLMIIGLAACGQHGATSVDAAASERAPLLGEFLAASDDALTVTGDVAIERGGLLFSKGAVLYTRTLNPRRGDDLVAQGGDSYAAIALGPADLDIELRRVTDVVLGAGARSLCEGGTPTYVALAHDVRGTDVTLLVFSGDDPPGSEATASRFCGAYVYVAPDGARTRQGVLLE